MDRRPTAAPDRPFAARGIGRRGWLTVARRTYAAMVSDRISLVAAGCAFYATLALFPAISMLISIYGLVFDPKTVEPQLDVLRGLLPAAAFAMIADRVHTLVSYGSGALGASLAVSTLIALWSASTGTKSMISALHLAYDTRERRGFLHFQLVGLAMTLATILAAIVAIAVLVFVPVVIDFLGLAAHERLLVHAASLFVLVAFVLAGISALYSIGHGRPPQAGQWIMPGALLATALWLAASLLFTFYVGHLASYDATYGPLGAVAGVMMWFWVSVYVVLLGAELNAELERLREIDGFGRGPWPVGGRATYSPDRVLGG